MSRRGALGNAYKAAGGVAYAGPAPDATDIGGWTVFTPKTAVAIGGLYNTPAQTGTRLIYISPSSAFTGGTVNGAVGSTSTPPFGPTINGNTPSTTWPDVYLWNGSAIIDSSGSTTNNLGAAYGTDPFNPNTAAIKPFPSYGFCGPRDGGQEIGTSGHNVGQSFAASGRSGFPDWYLFHRGETLDMTADTVGFRQLTSPGTTFCFDGICLPGSLTADFNLMADYGPLTLGRPRLINPNSNGTPSTGGTFLFKNGGANTFKGPGLTGWWRGIFLDYGPSRVVGDAAANAASITFFNSQGNTWALEDMAMDRGPVQWVFQNGDNNTYILRRCIVTNTFLDGTVNNHVQGWFFGDGPNTTYKIEDPILLRNGTHAGDPTNPANNWPNAFTSISVGSYDLFSRNMYLSGACNHRSFYKGGFSAMGGSGDQFRPGMDVTGSFFQGGYIILSNGDRVVGPYTAPTAIDVAGPAGQFVDNVQQILQWAPNLSAHPGQGLTVGMAAYRVDVWRNIHTRAQAGRANSNTVFAYSISVGNDQQWAYWPTTLCTVRGNIMDPGNTQNLVVLSDGGQSPSGTLDGSYNSPFPGLVANDFKYNVGICTTPGSSIVSINNTLGFGSRSGASKGQRISGWTASNPLAGVTNTTQTNPLAAAAVVGSPPAENWVLQCTNATFPTTWSVWGRTSGTQAAATEGTLYNNGLITFTIQNEGTPFVLGELITIMNATLAGGVSNGNTTDVSNNALYTSWANATAAQNFLDTDYTFLKYWTVALGRSLISGDIGDGLQSYLAFVSDPTTGMRRGQWRKDMTGKNVTNAFRYAWNMAALA